MKLLKILFLLVGVCISFNGVTQDVQNIRVNQSGNRINILYDLTGIGKAVNVDLFYTIDNGQTWVGPLKFLSGEISNVLSPTTDKRIVWDALTEIGEIKGNIQFKITMDFSKTKEIQPWTTDPNFRKYKTKKNVWLTTALVTGGAGVLAMIKSNSLYNDYQTAEDDAADIHRKIETYDIVYPVAFGIAAVSAVNFIIQAGKQGKAKKQLSFHPMVLPDGGGVCLTFKF
jgi:hypothetical protein